MLYLFNAHSSIKLIQKYIINVIIIIIIYVNNVLYN